MTGLRILRITDTMLKSMLAPGSHAQGYEVVQDGVPLDSQIVDIIHYPTTGQIGIKIASEEFEGPADGELVPYLDTRLMIPVSR